MKKSLLGAVAMAAIAPIFIGVGAASAASNYGAELVYAFDTTGDSSYAPKAIVTFGTKLAIELNNGELYVSDGTAAGTTNMTAVAQAAGLVDWDIARTLYDNYSVDIDGVLYFIGDDGDTPGVYKTDGVTIEEVATTNGAAELYYLNNELYLSTYSGGPVQIDITDGSKTYMRGSLAYDCDMYTQKRDMQYVNGLILFVYDDNNCDEHVVTWDPANPGNDPVSIDPFSGGLGQDSTDMDYLDDQSNDWFVWNDEMYFGAYANDGSISVGVELFKTDGTQAGTTLVKDINDGGQGWGSYPGSTNYTPFFDFNDELYFSAENSFGNIQLWKTDGTSAGTVVAVTSPNYPGDYTEGIPVILNGKFFQDFYTADSGNEPFMSDGTDDGTTLLVDTDPGSDSGMCWYNCQQAVVFDGHIFFIAWNGTENQVWETDGTSAGTNQVTTFGGVAAVGQYNDSELTVLGDTLYFGVNDTSVLTDATGNEALYKITKTSTELPNTGIDALGMTFVGLAAVGFISTGVVMVAQRRRANV